MFWKCSRKDGRGLRLFFATDIHGSEACFRKWLNAKKAYGVDLLVLGGDLAGKTIVPIVDHDDGTYSAEFLGVSERTRSDADLADLQRRISRIGQYGLVLTPEEKSELDASAEALHTAFNVAMRDRLRTWVRLAEERLGPDGYCFAMLGNDDPQELQLEYSESTIVRDAESRVHKLPGGYELVSCGLANTTPWNMPRDVPEDELLEVLEAAIGQAEDPSRAIFNFHAPPYKTELDQAAKLDENLRPVSTPGGGVITVPVGSKAVRAVIEKYQPLLSLHGHIHECSAMSRIGRTVCVNPGTEYASGVLRGAIVELRGNDTPRWQLTQG